MLEYLTPILFGLFFVFIFLCLRFQGSGYIGTPSKSNFRYYPFRKSCNYIVTQDYESKMLNGKNPNFFKAGSVMQFNGSEVAYKDDFGFIGFSFTEQDSHETKYLWYQENIEAICESYFKPEPPKLSQDISEEVQKQINQLYSLDSLLRLKAVKKLGKPGNDAYIPFLLPMLEDDALVKFKDRYVTISNFTKKRLLKMGGDTLIETLVKIYKTKDYTLPVSHMIVEFYDLYPDSSGIEILSDIGRDAYGSMLQKIIDIFGRIEDHKALEALEELQQKQEEEDNEDNDSDNDDGDDDGDDDGGDDGDD